MPLIYLDPPQQVLAPGRPFFTTDPDAFIATNIAMQTARQAFLAGKIVATHCGLLLDNGEAIEAVGEGVHIVTIEELLAEREVLVWTRQVAGMTPRAVQELCRVARRYVGTPYDFWALAGFTISNSLEGENPLQAPDKVFCSELVVMVLLEVAKFLAVPLPGEFTRIHPSRWTPQMLNTAAIYVACS